MAGITANPVGRVGVDLVPAEQSLLISTVKDLVERLKVKTKKVVVSIPEPLVFTKVMYFPFMSTPELATAIRWEAEQSIPYPVDKLELSWVVLYKPKGSAAGEKMKVLVVGVPSKTSDSYVNFLDSAGLEPVRFENEVLSLTRSLVALRNLPGISLIVDIGYSGTKMAVTDGKDLFANYVSPLGGQAFTKIIADVFKLNLTQAEEYKRSYGLDKGQLEGKIVAACEPVTGGLIGDIKKVIVSFTSQGLDRPIDRVILVGGGSFLKGLLAVLTSQLGLEVGWGNAFEGLKVNETIKNMGGIYANAVGLAIEE